MKIAVLGLGIIGQIWAKNFKESGFEVRTWNRTPKKVDGFEPDAKKAIAGAEIIFVIVSDPAAVQGVLDQIVPTLTKEQIVIQSSTISASWTKKFAQQVEKTGAKFLEAPFTGSKGPSEQRQTVFYVGGDKKLLDQVRPVLEKQAKSIIHIGPIGSASSIKLAMNMNLAQVTQALCESLAFTRSEGVPDEKFFEALAPNSGWSPMVDIKKSKLEKKDFSPAFSIKNMLKDLRLALESAHGVSFAQTQALKAGYEEGVKRGWGEDDIIGLVRLMEK